MFRGTLPSMSARPVALMALVLLIAACGGSNEAESGSAGPVTTAGASASDPAPATMKPASREPDLAGNFDVGGHSLHIECRGKSGPVVVFDAGSGSDGATWSRSRKDFIGLIDNTYQRCVYDRANLGDSDDVPGPRTSATAAEELHRLLHAAGLEPPYVLVGRSFGGYNVRLFAGAYPSEVRALILVETLTPEFIKGMESLLTPEQWSEESKAFEAIEAPLDELASGPLVAAAPLPDVPLLVVAGTKWHLGNEPWPSAWPGPQLDALWDQAQQDLGSSVPRGKTVVFQGGDHSLHFSQPERLAREINDFLASL